MLQVQLKDFQQNNRTLHLFSSLLSDEVMNNTSVFFLSAV